MLPIGVAPTGVHGTPSPMRFTWSGHCLDD